MKKNLISVVILALVFANFVLTALLMFSVLPETKKANTLIEKVCSAIDLDLNSGAATGTSNISIDDQEIYKVSEGEDLTTNLAEGKDGTAEVEFVFDGSNLAGKTLVAFEKLYYGDKLYAVHTDLEDEDQTIHVPSAGTTASDKNTGTHHAYAGEYVELTDTIEYRNLLPGETYTWNGSREGDRTAVE